MSRLFAAFACAGSLCVSAPTLAIGSEDDATATRAYLRADEAYGRTAYAEVAANAAAIEARTNEIVAECPSALTYAPRDAAFGELTEAAEMTVVYADVPSVRSTALHLAGAIEHLRWGDGRLERLVHSQAVGERSIATLALPDICVDIAAWRASAYATPPSSVTGFLARLRTFESGVGPSEESIETVILRLLRPYETQAERRIVKRIERLEALTNRRLSVASTVARAKLAAALGVSAL